MSMEFGGPEGGGVVNKVRRDLGNGSEVLYLPRWFQSYEKSWEYFYYLDKHIPWTRPTIHVFGKPVVQARDVCYIASKGLKDLVYSGYQPDVHSWDDYPPLKGILEEVHKTFPGSHFNSLLINRYNGGNDYVGWHADDEKLYGPNPEIASISFGCERDFFLKKKSQVADILLWRNKSLTAAILLGFTMIWFLFEVLEYNFVTLVCHITILVMLMVFVTYTTAKFTDWDLPDIHEITLQESAFKWLYRKLNLFLLRFYEISSGENFLEFFMVIGALWMISVIGNHFSSLNLLFFCVICLGTLPALYEEYEKEVDHLISKGKKDATKMLKKLDAEVLKKIPRGRVKEKKHK